MITVISATNRKGSASRVVASYYYELLKSKSNEEVKFLSLEDLSKDLLHGDMYSAEGQQESLAAIQDDCILPANKLVFIAPEYNGSYPGILKLFLDACSVREYVATFKDKKIGLVGVASGRAGNLRGLDHLTGIFNHVGSHVMPNKLPLSAVKNLLDDSGKALTDEGTKSAIAQHIDRLLAF